MEARSCFSHSGSSTRVPGRAVQRESFAKDLRRESALFFWMLQGGGCFQWHRHTIKPIPLKQNQLQDKTAERIHHIQHTLFHSWTATHSISLWAFCLTFNALLRHLKHCTFVDRWRGNLGPFLLTTPLHLLCVPVKGMRPAMSTAADLQAWMSPLFEGQSPQDGRRSRDTRCRATYLYLRPHRRLERRRRKKGG